MGPRRNKINIGLYYNYMNECELVRDSDLIGFR